MKKSKTIELKPKRKSLHSSNGANVTLVHGDSINHRESRHEEPYKINPETQEEEAKRLAKRKRLTLRVFRQTYENYHRRKIS